MKKFLMSALAIMLSCIVAMAGSPLKVESGSLKPLKNESGKIFVKFDFKGATYDKKKPLENEYPNLQSLMKISWEEFSTTFDKKCDRYSLTEKKDAADYQMTIKVTNMDKYYRAFGWTNGYVTKIWGTATITDLKSGEEIVVLEIDECDGGCNYNTDRSLVDAYEKLGQELAQKINKGK